MSSSKEKLSSPSPHGHHHSHGFASRSVEVDLASFCIFNSTLGPKEGEELKKILLYFPSDVTVDAQIRHVGLLEAVTKFVSSFSDKNCRSMQTSQQLHVTYQPEEEFWMAMTFNLIHPADSTEYRAEENDRLKNEQVPDEIYHAALRRSYEMYSLLNGTFSVDGMDLGIDRLKSRLHDFFSDYLQRAPTGYANLMQHFAALTYLPMDRKNFFGVQSFINSLTLRFSEVKHVLLQYSGLIIWNDIDLPEAVTASHYISKFLHPDVLEKEMQAIHSSNPPQQTVGVRLGRYYHGPTDHSASRNSDFTNVHAYLRTGGDPNSVHMTRYGLVIYGMAGALITLFLKDSETYESNHLARLETFSVPSLGSLAQSLSDQYLKFRSPQWSQDNPHVKYLYINEATLAQKQTLVDKNQVVQVEFLKALIGIYEDAKSHSDYVEIYEKVFQDCWIYGKRTFDRSLYAIVTQRNIDLALAEEELRKLYLKEFPDSHETMA